MTTEKEDQTQRQIIERRIENLESTLRQQLSHSEIEILDELLECYRLLCSIVAMENRIRGFQHGITTNTSD